MKLSSTAVLATYTLLVATSSFIVEAGFVRQPLASKRASVDRSRQIVKRENVASSGNAAGYCRPRRQNASVPASTIVAQASGAVPAAGGSPSSTAGIDDTTVSSGALTNSEISSPASTTSSSGDAKPSSSAVPSSCVDAAGGPRFAVQGCKDLPPITTTSIATSYVDITSTVVVTVGLESSSSPPAPASSALSPAASSAPALSSQPQHAVEPSSVSSSFVSSIAPSITPRASTNTSSASVSASLSESRPSSVASSIAGSIPGFSASTASSIVSASSISTVSSTAFSASPSLNAASSSAPPQDTTISLPSSVASSPSSIVPSSVVPSSAPSSVPSNGVCPPGSSWKTLTDDFASFDGSRWTKELGSDKQVEFGPNGLLMTLNNQSANIVYQSTAKWLPPVSLSASIKSARAPGIISCAIFGQAGSDEIDLELIEGSWQVPMWHNGKRLEKGQDVTYTLPSESSRELANWVFDDKKAVPFERVHDWKVEWQAESLTWSADGNVLLDVKKKDGGSWPTQALPFRWGPWAAPAGWAGKLDWEKNPAPVMQLRKVAIEGCQLD